MPDPVPPISYETPRSGAGQDLRAYAARSPAPGDEIGPLARLLAWLAETRTEAVFTALTFAGMMTGLVGEWTDAPDAVSWAGYGAAYVFGGWFGLRAGLDAIRDFKVDIDLLMILAALGALAIGAPFEGAMLLFLARERPPARRHRPLAPGHPGADEAPARGGPRPS